MGGCCKVAGNGVKTVIEVRGLRKAFGDVVALDSVDLQVRQGEVFGLVGPDGAGKTTLMRILAGLVPPDEGEALVAGRDLVSWPESVKPHTGYLAQAFALYDDLTVEENVTFCARVYGVARAAYQERLSRLLRITRLAPFTDRLAEHLSGGMRQKLGLMCALIHRPEVLFLDEPTTGVDPASRRDFWRLLYGLPAEGVAILVSTPYMDEAERCDRIALIQNGRILARGTPDALKATVTGCLFSVEATPRAEARRLLEAVPHVESVTVFGNRLHVAARQDTTSDVLLDALRRAAVEVACVEQIEPSLEDVFTTTMQEVGARVG
jgi:ABC-2 type transport system ATP-binding protein